MWTSFSFRLLDRFLVSGVFFGVERVCVDWATNFELSFSTRPIHETKSIAELLGVFGVDLGVLLLTAAFFGVELVPPPPCADFAILPERRN